MPQNMRKQHAEVEQFNARLDNIDQTMGDVYSQLKIFKTQLDQTPTKDFEPAVNSLTERLKKLELSHAKLKQTTVGTREHQQAMDSMVTAVTSVVEIAATLPQGFDKHYQNLQSTVNGILTPLNDMARVLTALQELAREPLQLSDNAIEQLGTSIEGQLTPTIKKSVQTSLDETREEFITDFENAVDRSIAKLEAEREVLCHSTSQAAGHMENMDKFTKSLFRLLIPTSIIGAFIAVGFVVIGGALGFINAAIGWQIWLPQIWENSVSATSWGGHLGWAALGLAIIGGACGVVWLITRWLWEVSKEIME